MRAAIPQASQSAPLEQHVFEKVIVQVPFKRRRKETRGPEGNTVNISQHRCMSNYDQSQSKHLSESPEGQGPGREISGLST